MPLNHRHRECREKVSFVSTDTISDSLTTFGLPQCRCGGNYWKSDEILKEMISNTFGSLCVVKSFDVVDLAVEKIILYGYLANLLTKSFK